VEKKDEPQVEKNANDVFQDFVQEHPDPDTGEIPLDINYDQVCSNYIVV
jgi:hypothetical protein